MIIKQLEFTNWMNLAEVFLDTSEGISAFVGKNGQGKSAVFAGVGYMLSDYRRGDSWKDYVRTGEDSFNIKMILSMSTNPRDLMYFDFSGDLPSETTSKSVSYKGKTYLNSDANTFINTTFDSDMVRNVLLTLQDSKPISSLTPSEGREIFKKVFNSDFEDVSIKIKADIEVKKLAEATIKNDIANLTNKTYTLKDETPADESNLPILKQELLNAQNGQLELDKYKFYLQKMQLVESYQKEVQEFNWEIATKQELEKTLQAQYDATDGYTISTKESLELANADLEKAKVEVTKAQVLVDNATIERTGIELSKGAVEIQIEHKQKMVNSANADLQVILTHIKAHEEGFCSNCGQKTDANNKLELDENYKNRLFSKGISESALANLVADKNDLVDKLQEKDTQIRTLTAKVAEAKTQVVRIEGSITNLNQKLENIAKEKSMHLQSITRCQTEQDITIKKKVAKQLLLSQEEDWCKTNAMTQPTVNTRPVYSIQNDIDAIVSKVQAVQLNKQYNLELLEQKKQDTEKVAELNSTLNSTQLDIKDLTAVKKIFDSEFPNYINLRACNLLEGFINSFFESVKPHFMINISLEKKGVILKYKSIPDATEWRPIPMVSGFESALLSIAFRVAVAQAFGSEILILDEPDGPADLDNSEALFQQISNIQGFRQIFVISHKPNAIDLLKESGASIWNVQNGQFSLVES